MKLKSLKRSDKFLRLLDHFDDASLDWGWQSDQGYLKEVVKESQELYSETKLRLVEWHRSSLLKRRSRRAVANLLLEHYKRLSFDLGYERGFDFGFERGTE